MFSDVVIVALSVLAVLLAAWLAWEVRRRRGVEADLHRLRSRLSAELDSQSLELSQVRDELSRVETQSRVFLDTAVDAVVTINQGGIIDSFNAAAERIFGYASSEVVGRNVSILMPSPYREDHDGYLARYLKTGERHIIGIGREVLGRRKDGAEFPIQLFVGETDGPGERRFTGILRDVTDRVLAEQRIREQASLLDKVREAIIVVDLEDRVLFWSQGAERTYGWKVESVLGEPICRFLFGEAPPEYREALRAVSEKGEWSGEFRHKRKTGSDILVESHWSLLLDKNHRPRGRVILNIDVTEREKLELQIRRAQRLESIGTLAAGIAHDLNNLLTPILLAVRLLQRDRPPQERENLLQTAKASVERGTELVKQLLSFAGGVEGERVFVDLRSVVQEVESLLRHALPKSIELHVELAEDLVPIQGDPTQLSQVLMNLAVNARDAMPQGGRLTISAKNILLNGTHSRPHPDAKPGPYALLSVEDTGAGISPANLERVFDPFFTTKEQGKGTGLGLSTALGIAKSHEGFMNIYSEEGKGTRVTVFLPASKGPTGVDASAPPPVLPRGAGEMVLVVDDEPSIRATTVLALEGFGYSAIAAADGREAIELYRQRRDEIAAVVLDIMMPVMDGLETIRRLKQFDPHALIIATSGIDSRGRRSDALAAGAQRFLQKPYSDEEILRALEEMLGRPSRPR